MEFKGAFKPVEMSLDNIDRLVYIKSDAAPIPITVTVTVLIAARPTPYL